MWRKVWKLPVKLKMKHFLWKCIHNWLATGTTVKPRGMGIDETCKRCGLATESREHLFFHCQESALIWKLAPVSWEGIQNLTESLRNGGKPSVLPKMNQTSKKKWNSQFTCYGTYGRLGAIGNLRGREQKLEKWSKELCRSGKNLKQYWTQLKTKKEEKEEK